MIKLGETVETAPVEEIQVEKPKSNIWKIVVPVVIVVIVLGAVLAYWWFSRPPQTPWLFKGAYAEYRGETTVLSYSVNMTWHFEVVDYNSTHAKLLTYMKWDMDGESYTEQETMWSDLRENTYYVEGAVLKTSYEDYVYLEGLGTRYCKVLEYSIVDADMTITFYLDMDTEWPLKMSFGMTELDVDFNVDLTLVETNIPGLK